MQFCLFSKKKQKQNINKHVYNFALFFNQTLCCVCNLFKKESVLTGTCDTGNTLLSTPHCICGVCINIPACSAGGWGGDDAQRCNRSCHLYLPGAVPVVSLLGARTGRLRNASMSEFHFRPQGLTAVCTAVALWGCWGVPEGHTHPWHKLLVSI